MRGEEVIGAGIAGGVVVVLAAKPLIVVGLAVLLCKGVCWALSEEEEAPPAED